MTASASFGVVEQERQVDDRRFLDDADQQPRIEHDQVDGTALQRGDVLQVAAERAAGELLSP